MVEGIFALIGVVIGSFSTVGFQMWEARRERKAAADSSQITASTQIMDAFWGRLDVAVRFGDVANDDRAGAFEAWGRARARFLESDIEGRETLSSWMDLVLTEMEEYAARGSLTWHDATIRHGRVHEGLLGWRSSDDVIRGDVVAERKRLAARFWEEDPANPKKQD